MKRKARLRGEAQTPPRRTNGSGETDLEIFVAEAAYQVEGIAAGLIADDRGQLHPIEGVGLDHGVNGHVGEHQPVAGNQGGGKGVFPGHVSGQAGEPADSYNFV